MQSNCQGSGVLKRFMRAGVQTHLARCRWGHALEGSSQVEGRSGVHTLSGDGFGASRAEEGGQAVGLEGADAQSAQAETVIQRRRTCAGSLHQPKTRNKQ